MGLRGSRRDLGNHGPLLRGHRLVEADHISLPHGRHVEMVGYLWDTRFPAPTIVAEPSRCTTIARPAASMATPL